MLRCGRVDPIILHHSRLTQRGLEVTLQEEKLPLSKVYITGSDLNLTVFEL